jgi:hypothetical protein
MMSEVLKARLPLTAAAALGVFVTGSSLLVSAPAVAVTATAPTAPCVTPDGALRTFSISSDHVGAISCYAAGEGNDLNTSPDPFAGYSMLDVINLPKDATGNIPNDAVSGEIGNGSLSLTYNPGASSDGTVSFASSLLNTWNTFLISFKTGVGQRNPDWAAFLISGPYAAAVAQIVASYNINPDNQGGGLSHVSLWGRMAPPGGNGTETPLPGALVLFATGLAGAGVIRWRRQRAAPQS